uniref:helix-turn-helix domain-containing protein n=1 Tax=Polynucleobacter sp. TaxID=2029855 RepID=UPI004047AD2B
MKEKKRDIKITRIKVDFNDPKSFPKSTLNKKLLDATGEKEIAKQKAQDDLEAKMDAALYAKSIREKLGFTQKELSERIMVPLDTIRNWEQGKRYPTGPARLLLKILDKAPKLVLQVI